MTLLTGRVNSCGMDDYYVAADEKHKKKERVKARQLRASAWWQNKLAEGLCYYCGSQFLKKDLTMDHKVPVARGGRSSKSNLVLSCQPCNTQKKHFTPVEMLLQSKK